MLVMFSAFLLILGSYYHNLPFHNNKEAFLALVGVLEHVSDVHDVHTPKKQWFWIMGLKNIQKSWGFTRWLSSAGQSLCGTWHYLWEPGGDNVIIFENLEGGEQLVVQLD